MRRQVMGLALRALVPEATASKALTASGNLASGVGALQQPSRGFAEAAPAGELKKTPLHDFHVRNGGKMVDFAGWSMPVQYEASVMDSSKHCRSAALLFDVSHMCGLSLKGKDAIPFLQKLVVGDIAGLGNGRSTLSVLTNENGGIIDDSVITKVADDDLYIVVNAGRRTEDLAHFNKHLSENSQMNVDMTVHDDRGLLALQGPLAAKELSALVDTDLSKFYFGSFTKMNVAGVPCWVTRTGYTGEDGFELSIPAGELENLASKFTSSKDVLLGGLGARDALRLEAGLCLYGNDITEETSPIEAGLTWTIAKSRRDKCDFLGGEVIKRQLAEGVGRKRVGLFVTGPPARQHAEITDDEGHKVGEVTSGAFSPSLGKPIGMGYVNTPLAKKGTKLMVKVRGKSNPAEVTKMPFVPAKYYKG